MARKANIPPEQEAHAYDLFMQFLPYYWATADEVPARALVHMQTWKCMPGRSKKA